MKTTVFFLLFPLSLLLISFNNQKGNELPVLDAVEVTSQEQITALETRSDWPIAGYIYKDENHTVPFPDVTVNFGTYGSVVTDENGFYLLNVPTNWSGIVTPMFCGFNFEFVPVQRIYTSVKKAYTQQNYWGQPAQMYTISGVFTHGQSGIPLANTTVTFDNGMSVTTNETGEYSIAVQPCWSGTLTPVSTEWNFSPASRTYQDVTSNQQNQDYTYIEKSFGLPPGWEYVNTGTVHIISVFPTANPNLCGIPMQPGDYIGVFYVGEDGELHCGGAGEWTGTASTAIMAQGNDAYTSIKDGFSNGETLKWKLFTWTSDQKEYTAFPTYQTGGYLVSDNKWYAGGLSIVQALNLYYVQDIVIPAGWSGLSGHFTPRTNLITSIMQPILPSLVIMQSMTHLYYPSQGINSIIAWNVNQGYKVKVSQEVVLPFYGCPLTNRSQTLPLNWSIMPVKSECNVSIQQLFNPIINRVRVVKEVAGNNVFWPAMGINTLQTLTPGKAYMVSMSQSGSVTFPACTGMKSDITDLNAIHVNKTSWPDPATSPSSHIIAFDENALIGFAKGDFIGAFTQEGIIAGLTEIAGFEQSTGITVFGADPTEFETVGFAEGEVLSFKLFKSSTGEVFDLLAEFDPSMPVSDGTYADNGLSLVTDLHLNSTGSADLNQGENPRLLPNPSNGNVNLVASGGAYKITIFDVLGSVVFDQVFSGNSQMDLTQLHKGMYFAKIEGEGFVKVEKLILK
jgi:hypothetical protein